MLDLARLNHINLSSRPLIQRIVASIFLIPNYRLPPQVNIVFEGLDKVPNEPVIFAMNHTDRFNYWPFQVQLWQQADRYTATWVKGKYYEHDLLGKAMEWINSIPAVSRGYLVVRDFIAVTGRSPSNDEYRALRNFTEGKETQLGNVPSDVLSKARNVLGVPYNPNVESYDTYLNNLLQAMTRRFVELNQEAFSKGLDLIIFPEGTRSIRLSQGHIGISQIAMKYRKTIVPVGCNNCDQVYPGSSPIARGGTVTYRFGDPITWEDAAAFHPEEDFEPFHPADEEKHREKFQGLADLVMDRINPLLDPRHQRDNHEEKHEATGSDRFV